ncbi:MAG: DUF6268 family outer membrane beta-barrel protein [Saonia sp.]
MEKILELKYNYYLLSMLSLIYVPTWCQMPDPGELGRFEYSMVPSLGDTDLRQYGMHLTGGKKLKSGMVGLGLSYTKHEFSFFNTFQTFDESLYENIHTVRASFFYRRILNDSWSMNIGATPTLSGNFKNNVSSDDLVFNVRAMVSKKWKSETGFSVLSFGIGYGTFFGEPQILPAFSFRKIVNRTWSYFLGIPTTGVNYNFNERHSIRARGAFSGLYANNSATTPFEGIGNLTNTKIRYNGADLGLEHHYRIQPNFTTVIRMGYLLGNRLEILDEANDLLYDFEPNGSAYVSIGLKFNINKTMNENGNQ